MNETDWIYRALYEVANRGLLHPQRPNLFAITNVQGLLPELVAEVVKLAHGNHHVHDSYTAVDERCYFGQRGVFACATKLDPQSPMERARAHRVVPNASGTGFEKRRPSTIERHVPWPQQLNVFERFAAFANESLVESEQILAGPPRFDQRIGSDPACAQLVIGVLRPRKQHSLAEAVFKMVRERHFRMQGEQRDLVLSSSGIADSHVFPAACFIRQDDDLEAA